MGHLVCYRAARVIDGVSKEPIEDGCVVVEGDRIVYVGRFGDEEVRIDDLQDIEDLGDATALPGLIDAHVHLVWSASRAPHQVVDQESRYLTVLRAAANTRAQLRSGVTTVRDVGSTDAIAVEVARAIDNGVAEGARVVAAGRAIVMTGGHAWWIGREADGPEDVRRAVREELKGGARCIKLMASGGVLGHAENIGSPQLTVDELRAGVEVAHSAGVHTTAHAYSPQAIQNALDAGIDAIEHASFLTAAQAEEMRERGIFLVPTLSVYRAMADNADRLELPDYIREKTGQVLNASVSAFRLALQHDVPIAAGTDAGSPGHPHYGALAAELEAMVDAGATAMKALHFATGASAKLVGKADDVGTIQAGKRADLTVVAGNPATDISCVRNVRLVLKEGVDVLSPGCSVRTDPASRQSPPVASPRNRRI
jgi:imidazolonepropionase-like amidohydrolase